MKEHLDNMIALYQSFWELAKKHEQEALQNQKTKFNRQKLLRARAQKECYADFVNHLVGFRSVSAEMLNKSAEMEVAIKETIELFDGNGVPNIEWLKNRLSETLQLCTK